MLRKIIRNTRKLGEKLKGRMLPADLFKAQQLELYHHELETHEDLGRRLQDYERIHQAIKKQFTKRKLSGKKFVHFGSGNTNYCDYLNRKYGVRAFAVDPTRIYLNLAREKGSKALRVPRGAEEVRIKPNSVDIILSDHFLFAHFGTIAGERETKMFRNAIKSLKVGGILILERCTGYDLDEKIKNLISVYEKRVKIIDKQPWMGHKIKGEMFVLQKVAE